MVTGTPISHLPTGTIDNLQAVFPLSIGMPTGTQTIRVSLQQEAQFLQSQGQMISGTWTQLQGRFQPSGTALVSGPQAFGDNYVLTPSISNGGLVLALKTIAGADPSASDKIWFRIGNSRREVTSALSLSLPTGTSTFNAGSSELATKDIDYFAYAGWRASNSSMFLLTSRIPYAKNYGDFSATATNEKYGAYSGVAPASTDPVENIGRFRARLSASSAYVWSLPSGVVINRPIYETDWLDWQPTYGAGGSMTYTSVTTTLAKYMITGNIIKIQGRFVGTTGGSASTYITATSPFDFARSADPITIGAALHSNGFGGAFMLGGTPDLIAVERADASNFPLTAGMAIEPTGFAEI